MSENIVRITENNQETDYIDVETALHYHLEDMEELMGYTMLIPRKTNLTVDIFVDDGGAYKRDNHPLLVFVRNGYDINCREFIPISVSANPFIMDDSIRIKLSDSEIMNIMGFIVNNRQILKQFADDELSIWELTTRLAKVSSE